MRHNVGVGMLGMVLAVAATLACVRPATTTGRAPDAGCPSDAGCVHAGPAGVSTSETAGDPTGIPAGSWLLQLWGAAPDDIWAIGNHGLIVHFDGRAWRREPSGTTVDLEGIAGRAGGEAWIVGQGGTILRLRGHTWTREDLRLDGGASPLHDVYLAGVWVAPNGTVWVGGSVLAKVPGEKEGTQACLLGRHEEGGTWLFDYDAACTPYMDDPWGTGPDDVWASCNDFFVHWNGRRLVKHPHEKPPPRRGRHGFAGGWRMPSNGRLSHPLHPSPPLADGSTALYDFWAFGTDDVWAVRNLEILHFDGRGWTSQPAPR